MKQLYQKFEQYIIVEKRLAKNTVQAYQNDLAQALDFFTSQGCLTFYDVKTATVSAFLYHIKFTLGVQARSSARKLSALKSLAKYLAQYHGIDNFTHQVSFPKIEKNLPQFLTQEQIVKLFEVTKKDQTALGKRNHLMITLAYVSGVRVSELVALKVSNINFDDHQIKVCGKGNKERIIPLHETICDMLAQYLQYDQPYIVAGMKIDSDYIFPIMYAQQIKPMTRQSFWAILKEVVVQAGLPESISPHVLRHSIATHLLKNGANLRLLQVALGHKKIETVQVYTHVELSHIRILYDKFHPRA